MVAGDIVAGSLYTFSSFMIRYYIDPNDLSWVDLITWWYSYVILPFNILVLLSVLSNKYTDVSMPMFYASRYLDYVSTVEILRKRKYEYFHLDVFHHATVPILIRLGWDDKYLLRFCVFLIGIAAAAYTSRSASKELVDESYLQSLSIVQWTQYVVVVIHTIRTSSKFKRAMFFTYIAVFTVLVIQYMLMYSS
jgi:hypothetical protein